MASLALVFHHHLLPQGAREATTNMTGHVPASRCHNPAKNANLPPCSTTAQQLSDGPLPAAERSGLTRPALALDPVLLVVIYHTPFGDFTMVSRPQHGVVKTSLCSDPAYILQEAVSPRRNVRGLGCLVQDLRLAVGCERVSGCDTKRSRAAGGRTSIEAERLGSFDF